VSAWNHPRCLGGRPGGIAGCCTNSNSTLEECVLRCAVWEVSLGGSGLSVFGLNLVILLFGHPSIGQTRRLLSDADFLGWNRGSDDTTTLQFSLPGEARVPESVIALKLGASSQQPIFDRSRVSPGDDRLPPWAICSAYVHGHVRINHVRKR
jgi:hypothetical protein